MDSPFVADVGFSAFFAFFLRFFDSANKQTEQKVGMSMYNRNDLFKACGMKRYKKSTNKYALTKKAREPSGNSQ